MALYGRVAIQATRLIQTGRITSPGDAWRAAARELFPGKKPAQEKACPRSTFLRLCESGLIAGVPGGEYTASSKNKEHALKAVRLLAADPALASEGKEALWRRVLGGRAKAHNHQMDVVLALWGENLVK
jgi:hypothetical protein